MKVYTHEGTDAVSTAKSGYDEQAQWFDPTGDGRYYEFDGDGVAYALVSDEIIPYVEYEKLLEGEYASAVHSDKYINLKSVQDALMAAEESVHVPVEFVEEAEDILQEKISALEYAQALGVGLIPDEAMGGVMAVDGFGNDLGYNAPSPEVFAEKLPELVGDIEEQIESSAWTHDDEVLRRRDDQAKEHAGGIDKMANVADVAVKEQSAVVTGEKEQER